MVDRRDQILSAVGVASSMLLRSSNWQDALQEALECLGKAAEANRAYYFTNHVSPSGELLTSQVAEWAATGIEPQIDNPELQAVPYDAAGMGRWVTVMSERKPIHGLISNFPDSEREVLEPQGIQSLVAMPVISRDQFVGFLGFDDCESFREWAKPEFDALFAAATAIGAAIDRHYLENQLRFAQKMEAVGSLAAGVAHDFNNMLQAIVGFTNIVKLNLVENHSTQPHLDGILAATHRAHSLTTQLLSFSSKRESNPKNINLEDVCKSVTAMVKPLLGKSITLTVDMGTPAPVIFADSTALVQILMNMCLNARDAMPNGGQLKIACHAIQRNPASAETESETENETKNTTGDYARISVIDTGCGMSPEVQSRIFEPFFTTKGIGRGTGLGLSVAYGTVQQYDGFIEVDSRVDEGTEFTLDFPIVASKESTVERPVTFPRGNETILLVEDEPMVLLATHTLLQAIGYQVLTADNGKKGLEVYRQHADKIALVLSDSVMPVMNGEDMIEAIQQLKPDLNAILISGYSNDSANRLADRDNIVLLDKPVSNQTLQKVIRGLLEKPGDGSKH